VDALSQGLKVLQSKEGGGRKISLRTRLLTGERRHSLYGPSDADVGRFIENSFGRLKTKW